MYPYTSSNYNNKKEIFAAEYVPSVEHTKRVIELLMQGIKNKQTAADMYNIIINLIPTKK